MTFANSVPGESSPGVNMCVLAGMSARASYSTHRDKDESPAIRGSGSWLRSLVSETIHAQPLPERVERSPHGAVLQAFLTANYTRLHQRLARHLGCVDLASDSLHDAWLRLGDMAQPTSVQNPEAYVYRIACNVATDRVRNDRPWQYAGDVEFELDAVADRAPGPDVVAEARSDLQALALALESLPARHRSVVVALRIEELTRQQVAALHGMSLRTVDTVLRQALSRCAEVSGQALLVGVTSPRRALPRRRR